MTAGSTASITLFKRMKIIIYFNVLGIVKVVVVCDVLVVLVVVGVIGGN